MVVAAQTRIVAVESGSWFYLFIYLFYFFWPHCMACRILVPQPGID